MFRSIQNYVEQLEAWMDDRKSILSLEKDILGKVIVGDSMTEAIRADLTETAARIIQRLLSAVITAFQRQFKPFLESNLKDPSPEEGIQCHFS